jgi:hypothetical protein
VIQSDPQGTATRCWPGKLDSDSAEPDQPLSAARVPYSQRRIKLLTGFRTFETGWGRLG